MRQTLLSARLQKVYRLPRFTQRFSWCWLGQAARRRSRISCQIGQGNRPTACRVVKDRW